MSASLPERPDLDQLRRQAKELRDAARTGDPGAVERFRRHHAATPLGGPVTLAAAQLVIARELGFASWPKLKAAVDVSARSPEQAVDAFVAASVERRMREAATILAAHPDIASRSLNAAAVLGEAEVVRPTLAADPPAAVAIDADRGWPPLLYACYSRWHQVDPSRAAGLAEVVRLLLDAGASPNTNNGARPHHGYRSALCGSAVANNPAITRLLLERGTNPDDGESLYHAAGHRDHACLELLLAHGATVAGTWALEVAVHAGDAEAVTILLRAAQLSGEAAELATRVLPDAAADAPTAVVASLLAAGAEPGSRDDDGLSALRRAVRSGNTDTAAALVASGAPDDASVVDRFVGACVQADRLGVERLLVDHAGLVDGLAEGDRAAIVDAAGKRATTAVQLMLDLGFSPHTRNELRETALHTAAYAGDVEAVRILIDAGAELDARDANFDGTPLGYATVGSGEQAGTLGDWVGTVRALLDAGASPSGVWVAGKPPSEEVADLLRQRGITPDDESGPEGGETDHVPLSTGTGVMADVAAHLEAAYRSVDLDLLGSLLHPQVRWTGLCNTSADVLDWYRGVIAGGTGATVESTEVHGDAVVLGILLTRQAEGARPAPPDRLFQVFTVADAQVVEIRGYPDRAEAIAATSES